MQILSPNVWDFNFSSFFIVENSKMIFGFSVPNENYFIFLHYFVFSYDETKIFRM